MVRCPECRAQLDNDDEFHRHIIRFHKKPVPTIHFQCSECNMTFSNIVTARKHRQAYCAGRDANDPRATTAGPSASSCEDMDFDPPVNEPQGAADPESDPDPDPDPNPNPGFDEPAYDANIPATEALQREAVDFLTRIKDQFNATQTIVNEIIDGVNKIQEKFLAVVEDLVRDKAGDAEVLSTDEVLGLLRGLKGLSLFEGVDTKDEILSYLQEHHGLVMPVKKVLLQEEQIRNNEGVMKDVDYFYFVPFLPQLKKLLSCAEVLHCVDNPKQGNAHEFETVLDGYMYRTHPVFQKDSKALAVGMYHDGIEVVDSTSSRTGKHHLTNFYWNLCNIYPELRSTDRVNMLLAAVETNILNKYGFEPILRDAIAGLNKLSSDEGITCSINGIDRVFHGMLLYVSGDYPASGAIAGFKESVSADVPCRECYASNSENYLQETDISNFTLRNKDLHEQNLQEIEAYNQMPPRERRLHPDPSVKYGVNSRSVLLDVKYFDVTKCMVQDLMHVGHEGVLELVCRLLLKNVVMDTKTMDIEEVNVRILQFSKYISSDKPALIKIEHLTKTLRQSAAQMRTLSLILPFVLRKESEPGIWTFPGDQEYLECFMSYTKIMHLSMAYKYSVLDSERLRQMVQVFHQQLLALCPNLSMAKVHFLHHLPDLIILFGSIRQVACFRFEAHHAFFKRILRIIHNFVNHMQSVTVRHQTRQCRQMMTENFLYEGHEISVKKEIIGTIDSNINLIKSMFPEYNRLYELTKLKMFGTTYRKDTIILLSESPIPEFGLIRKIFSVDDEFALICQKFRTITLNEEFNAYEIVLVGSKFVFNAQNLCFPHEILSIKSEGKWFAIPLGHRTMLT